MNREEVLETFFEEVKNACEWGIEKDKAVAFANYVDGMSSFVETLLKKIKNKNEHTICSINCKDYNNI